MPEICRFFGIIIGMFYNEHNPPHFHARYGEFEAEFEIHTLKIINGNLPKRAKAMVLEWAEDHREELLMNWEFARQMQEIRKLKPLE
ncbi:MAG: DUF4160 domain-containing protein [Bacteroidota bacterium]